MFSAIRRMTGFSAVSEKDGIITVSGLPADFIAKDIKKFWTTSKIASSMFTYMSKNEVRFSSFFAIEFEYIIRSMLEQGGTTAGRRVIKNIIEGLHENTWMARLKVNEETKVEYPKWLKREHLKEIKWKLLDHQALFLDRYERVKYQYGLRGMLLTAAAGGGKTISGISIALTTEADYCIIVSPKNAIYRVWEKTLNEEMVVPQKPYVADRDGTNYGDGKWYIFHYESLEKAMELAKKLRGKKVCVILDESHNFNDAKSLRTDRFLQMCNVCQASDIIWSSGTPIKALGYEAIPLIKSIDPMFNDIAEQGFRKMYGKDAKRTLDILKNRIGIVSYIVPKKEFMSDKPVEKTIKIQMPGSEKYTLEALSVVMKKFIDERNKFYAGKRQEYRKYYDAIIEIHKRTLRNGDQLSEFAQYEKIVAKFWKFGFDPRMDADQAVFANKYEKEKIHLSIPQSERNKFKDAKSVVKYPELKVRGECLGRILSKERMQCHVDMLPYVNFEELINAVEKKTIIFTSYVQVVDACHSHLEKLKMTPLRVYGATNNELPAIVGRFGSDEKINPLIATYQSLAVAVPLTMANGVILLNAPWRAYEREQAIARAYRIGQDKTVYVHDIILDTGDKTNISSRSIDIMQWSKDQVDSIMGTEGTTVSAESDLDTVYDVRWNVQWSIEGAVDDINFEGYEEESDVSEVPFGNNRSVYW